MKSIKGEIVAVGLLLVFAAAVFCAGIDWGLPTSRVDQYLFGGRPAWSGQKIQELTGQRDAGQSRGADVDVNPLDRGQGVIYLNNNDRARAEIVRRYRLFTYHPDEMVTLMSLAAMRPGQGDFDPRLYQYGGLWVYPVGAMLKAASLAGFVDLRGDVGYYLDHPEAFGRFYIVARLYVVLWGLLGVVAVYLIARRISEGVAAGPLVAAVCFILMPAVVSGVHEAKPHLGGVVLILWAVWAAARYLDSGRLRWWAMACVLSGAAVGMVLNAWPALAVVVLMPMLGREAGRRRFLRIVYGVMIAVAVYFLLNPYVLINLLAAPELLESNLANTRAMFHAELSPSALHRAVLYIVAGTTFLLALLGVLGVLLLARRVGRAESDDDGRAGYCRMTPCVRTVLLLAVPATLNGLQFIVFAAGQGFEYARFALLVDVLLCIVAVVGIVRTWPRRRVYGPIFAVLLVFMGWHGYAYIQAYMRDVSSPTTRTLAADAIKAIEPYATTIGMWREPAPYNMPPVDLFHWRLHLLDKGGASPLPDVLVSVDSASFEVTVSMKEGYERLPIEGRNYYQPTTPVTWADKPVTVLVAPGVMDKINAAR